LFQFNTSISSGAFPSTFRDCPLTSIPSGLFSTLTAISSGAFQSTFRGTSITSIPGTLFSNNTNINISAFQQTFFGCTLLTTITSGLFNNNTNVGFNSFDSTFANCSVLNSLPIDIFKFNALAQQFKYTFQNCGLATLGPDFFRNNTACTNFTGVFEGCTRLQLNSTIFYSSGEQSTRFLNQSVNFTDCFKRTSFTGSQGTAPDLWNCNFGTGTPTRTGAFGGAGNSLTSISNYNDIPVNWL
jgi:hypothetical protein